MRKEVVITGKVVRGDGYGQKLGFPTANLDRRGYSHLKCKPKSGIYAGTASILPLSLYSPAHSRRIFRAAIIIGPKDNKGLPKIEAYLIDFSGVLYGEKVKLSLMKHLRQFMSFKSEHVLKRQILKDIDRVRKVVSLTEGSIYSLTQNRRLTRQMCANAPSLKSDFNEDSKRLNRNSNQVVAY